MAIADDDLEVLVQKLPLSPKPNRPAFMLRRNLAPHQGQRDQ